MTTERYIRISALLYRKEGTTEAEFHRYWSEIHGPLVRDWFLRYDVVGYRQVHTTVETKALFAGAGSGALSCDGIADVYFKDLATYREAFKDPYYVEKVAPDEARFLNREKTLVTVGYDYVVIEEGKLVDTHERSY